MSWELLAVAVVLVFALAPLVTRVRELASLRFPSRVERRPTAPRLQAAVDDMLRPVEVELAELGFRFSHAAELRGTPRSLSPWQPVRVYTHHHYPLIAQLMAPGPVELPNLHLLVMLAQVREGLMVASANLPWSVVPPDPLVLQTAGEGFANARQQFDAQLAAMHAEGLPDFLPWGGPEDIEARLTQYENRTAEASVAQGWCRADGEALAVAPRRLPALAWRTLQRLRHLRAVLRQLPADAPALKTQAPLERGLLIFVAGKAVTRSSPPPQVQWALYAGSSALFLLLAALVFGFSFASALLAVVALHEAGHYLAMRAFGYRRTQMLMLPLIGGVAFGEESRPNAWHRALVGLAGPVPGLLIGLVLLWAGVSQPEVSLLAWLMVLINGLNLLPFHPLDGGHVLEALLPARQAVVRCALEVLALAGLVGLWWVLDAEVALLLAVLRVLTWRPMWRQLQFERWYRRAAVRTKPGDAKAVARLSFQLLDKLLPRRASLAQRIRMVDQLIAHLRYKPMGGARGAGVALVYVILLCLPLAAVPDLARSMHASFLSDAEKQTQVLADVQTRVRAMAVGDLVRALESRATAPPPASELALTSLAHRTGDALPDDVRQLYTAQDGLQSDTGLELYAVADVRVLRENRPRLASQLGKQLQELHPQRPTQVPMACTNSTEHLCGNKLDEVLGWPQLGTLHDQPVLLHPDHAMGHWRLVMLQTQPVELIELPALRELLQAQFMVRAAAALPPR